MSWTDKEIDQLFKESAEGVSFNYSDDYWKEMEAMLPQKKKRDFLWFITAFAFLGLVSLGFFRSLHPINESPINTLQASSVSSNADQMEPENNLTRVDDELATSDNREDNFANKIEAQNEGEFTTKKESSPNSDRKFIDRNVMSKLVAVNALSDSEGIGPIRGKVVESNQLYVDGTFLGVNESMNISHLNVNSLGSAIDKSLAPINIQPSRNKRILVSPYLEVHGGVSESPVANAEQIGSYYGAGAGIQLNSPYWTTAFGVNGSVYHFSDAQLTHFSKTYSYGSRYTTHELNYRNIYRIEGVVAIGRNFGRHQVNVGLRPSYIVSNKIDYVEIDEIKDTRTEKEVIGFTDGMNRFGIKGTIGYAFNVAPTWTVGVNLGLQTKSTFEQGFLGVSNSNLPMDGQIYLRKSLSFGK